MNLAVVGKKEKTSAMNEYKDLMKKWWHGHMAGDERGFGQFRERMGIYVDAHFADVRPWFNSAMDEVSRFRPKVAGQRPPREPPRGERGFGKVAVIKRPKRQLGYSFNESERPAWRVHRKKVLAYARDLKAKLDPA
jgi:hypothetical protein